MCHQSNNCLVSVVIPAYNAEKTLARAIQSVLDDLYSCKEILIVDDGSTDATRVVAEPFCKNGTTRVRLINRPHGGANKARNVGLQQSEGKYVQFLDADDWLINDKLHRSVDLFCSDENGDVCLVYSGRESINAVALASGRFSYFTHGINTVAAMWRRAYLVESELEWDEDLQCWQEAEFYFRALLKLGSADRILHLPGKYYERDTTTTGISSRYFSEGYILSQNIAIDRIYAQCRKLAPTNGHVDEHYNHYKSLLLQRSIVCPAPAAWKLLAKDIRNGGSKQKWKFVSYVPYPLIRGLYLVYKYLKSTL